ncbi:MAG: phosphoglycolate phosphatase [Rhizobiales bacterium]|nr:phosphoglycolate phosphatase [Hyphomicrobiales bacterium]
MAAPLLVFDLDGTLVDSAPDLLATLNTVLPRHGFAADHDPDLRDGIGHGARHLIEFALHRQNAAASDQQLDAMHRDFLDYYEANICVETRLYPGLLDLLDRFENAGWRFAVCTNKIEALSRLVLRKLGVAQRFEAVAGGDTFATRKPDPAHLLGAIAMARAVPDRALMVGDSRTDLDTARSAGVPVIGVSFGYTPVPMAELGPDLLLDSYDELRPEMAETLVAGRAQRPRRAMAAKRKPLAAVS